MSCDENKSHFLSFLIPDRNSALLNNEGLNDTRKASQIAAREAAGAGGDAATVSRAIVEDIKELPGVEFNCCHRFGTMFCFISSA